MEGHKRICPSTHAVLSVLVSAGPVSDVIFVDVGLTSDDVVVQLNRTLFRSFHVPEIEASTLTVCSTHCRLDGTCLYKLI